MGLPSVFEVFQLAIGPSTVFTTGALRMGQAFREVLYSSHYSTSHRILVELTGNFSQFGRENNTDQAVVAGLGGFTLEESGLKLKAFYAKIKEHGYFLFDRDVWPFNPESDLIFNDFDKIIAYPGCIRFHLLSADGQPVLQAEYYSIGNGLIQGPGIIDSMNVPERNSPTSLTEIKAIVNTEMISIVEFVMSCECSVHRISRDQFQKRMSATWKLMKANVDRGLKAQMVTDERFDSKIVLTYKDFLSQLSTIPFAGSDNVRASIYARVLSEEILNNYPVITAPTCIGSAIIPAVLRLVQEKFMFSDEKMVEALVVCGLYGALILYHHKEWDQLVGMQKEIAFSAIMAAAGIAFLMGGSWNEIESSATMAIILYGISVKKHNPFEPKMFVLLNSMIAQTLPALVDLSKIQFETMVPNFDDTLVQLFQ